MQSSRDNAPYVHWFGDRVYDYRRGAAFIDARLGYAPPIWAHSYRFVYGGNSSVGKFLQYTITGAFRAVNPLPDNDNKNIYLSLNSFKGEISRGTAFLGTGGYKESSGALVDYQYKEGDRLRIISYVPAGSTNGEDDRIYASTYLDFKVVGYEYLERDKDINPIYIEASSNGSIRSFSQGYGWTLIIQNPDRDDEWSWDYLKANAHDTNWNVADSLSDPRAFPSSSALIEIYSTTPENTKDVFYETSYSYEIGDIGLPTRYHKAERDQYSEYTIPIADVFAVQTNSVVLYDSTDFKLYIGDTVTFSGGASSPVGDFIIEDIAQSSSLSEIYEVKFDKPLTGAVNGSELGDTILKLKFAAVTIKEGDVWIRPRRLVEGYTNKKTYYDVVEDYYANDFFESADWACKGRVQGYSEYAKQEDRKASVWLSEAYFPSNNTNGLSAFNLSNADTPLKEYDRTLGSIQKLWARGDELIMLQENKVSFVRVGKDVLTTGDGGDIITLTSQVLSEQNPYKGDYGICMNPESFASKNGDAYFLDIKRGKVMRLASNGLQPISDYKISKLLDSLSQQYNSIVNSAGFKAYGGFDRDHDEYNLTFGQVTLGNVDDGSVGGLPDTPQIVLKKKTPIVLSNEGITGGEVHKVDFNLLPIDIEVGDLVILSFTESLTVDAGDPEVTDWYTSYEAVIGDGLNEVIDALGTSLVDEVEGSVLMGSFSNSGAGVLSLNFETTDAGVVTDAVAVDVDSLRDRITDVDPTDISIELPLVISRTPRETIDIEGVPTEVDVIDFEQLSTDSVVYLNKTTTEEYTTKVPVTVKLGDLNVDGKYDLPRDRLDIPLVEELTVSTGQTVEPLTIAFHEASNTWAGFRSYTPNGYANTNYIMLSFKDGEIWKHDRGSDYGNFYGTKHPIEISAVLPQESGINKVFNSLSTESNVPFEVDELYTNLTTTSFTKERFVKREGVWYSDIPKAVSTTSGTSKNIYGVGGLDSQIGNNITFQSKINEVGIVIGDELINSSGSVSLGFVTAIVDDFTVTASLNISGTQGQFIYGVKNAKVDGDAARGVYMVVKLRSDSDEFVELFAVNSNIDLSNLTLPQT